MKEKMSIFQELVQSVPLEIQNEVDLSFAIADRIELLLNEKSMTQKDLALRLGKKESEVSKWLRGTHNFTIRTLAKLSVALGEDIIQVYKPEEETRNIYIYLSSDSVIPIEKSDTFRRMTCREIEHNEVQMSFINGNSINN